MFSELVKKNRSRRRYNGEPVSFTVLRQMVEDCRYSASTMNRQDIRYVLVNDEQICRNIFNITNLPSKHKINIENRPGAFIVMTVEKGIEIPDSFLFYNVGIATANLTLSATSLGYDCVTLLSTNMEKLGQIVSLDDKMKAVSVIAVGKSNQEIKIENIDYGDLSYYKKEGIHTVPKFTLKTIISREI